MARHRCYTLDSLSVPTLRVSACALLAACAFTAGCADDRDYAGADDSTRSSDAASAKATSTTGTTSGRTSVASSADARILSTLHAKNLEEIEAGRLAQQNGSSAGVRSYGETLVRDHTANDAKVMQVARDTGISLMTADEAMRAANREKGQSTPSADPLADLRKLRGEQFDSTFTQRVHSGHRELIQTVEAALPNVRDQKVRTLLNEMLPVLRDHERRAMNAMPGHTAPAPASPATPARRSDDW